MSATPLPVTSPVATRTPPVYAVPNDVAVNRTVPSGFYIVTRPTVPASVPTANGCPPVGGGGGGGGGSGGGEVSLSTMVTVPVVGEPMAAPPVGADSATVNGSFPSTAASSVIATVNVFGAVSPAAQLSVPVAVVKSFPRPGCRSTWRSSPTRPRCSRRRGSR